VAISFTGESRLLSKIYDLVYRLLKALYRKPHIQGFENIRPGFPAVYVANHQNSYGPIILMTRLPFLVYPWVTYEITDRDLCPIYVEKDFIYKELRLKPPLSLLLATIIGRICVSLMQYLEAIPVYRHNRNVSESLRRSVIYLEEGRNLLLFPEIPELPLNEHICMFDNGFVRIAKQYAENNGGTVLFYPVAVNRVRRYINIGKPVQLSTNAEFHMEKRRIARELRERICDMLENAQQDKFAG